MNRIPILSGGAVLAAIVLCGGAVTMANAMTATPTSQVLGIAGVSSSPTASPTPTESATAEPTPSASATATPSPTTTPEPGDDNGGVTVVSPSDPTKILGKGCAHLEKNGTIAPGTDDPAGHNAGDTHGVPAPVGNGENSGSQMHGTPVPQDPDKSLPAWPNGFSGGSKGPGGYPGGSSGGWNGHK